MALSTTIGTLVTDCQRRADMEGNGHIATAEWKSLISEAYGELHGIAALAGMLNFVTEETLTLPSPVSLPSGHLSTIGVDRVDAAGRRSPLYEIMIQERSLVAGLSGEACHYCIVGSTIELYPAPTTGTYKHLYIPQATDYSSSSDATTIDLIAPDGRAFLVWSVAVKALSKEEGDVGLAMAEREAARARFSEWVQLRSFVTPRRQVSAWGDTPDPGDPRWWL